MSETDIPQPAPSTVVVHRGTDIRGVRFDSEPVGRRALIVQIEDDGQHARRCAIYVSYTPVGSDGQRISHVLTANSRLTRRLATMLLRAADFVDAKDEARSTRRDFAPRQRGEPRRPGQPPSSWRAVQAKTAGSATSPSEST
jgi:hypothetical protein